MSLRYENTKIKSILIINNNQFYRTELPDVIMLAKSHESSKIFKIACDKNPYT